MDSAFDSAFDAEISAQLLAFADQTTDFVGISDPWGRVLYLNPAARKRLGVADATDLTTADFFPVEAFTLYYEQIRPHLLRTGAWSGEVPVNVGGGVAVPMYLSTSTRLGPGGETNGNVVYAHELSSPDPVAARRGSDADEDVELLERAAFEERVGRALDTAHRDGESCALVLASVVDVSDTVDDLIVATVMRAVGGRLLRLARMIDIVGHAGENQFGVLLRGVRSHSEALRIGWRMYESLVDAPVATPGGDVAPLFGCGVAFAQPGDDLARLIEQASATMWHEVLAGAVAVTEAPSGASVGVGNDGDGAGAGSPTIDELRVGMSTGEIRAYAQPVVDLGSGQVVAYRGGARWQHRDLGMLDAPVFVPMVADTALANQIDLYVARETAAVLALKTRATRLRMYAPVSRRLIADIRAEQYLSEIADAFSLVTPQICLQLARPLLEDWTPALDDALRALRDAGVTLALTDVGAADEVRSFAHHGFRELHLARPLTDSVATDTGARDAVTEIVLRAHDHGWAVAATGVDEPQQRDILVAAGCDLARGDLYGCAEPANTID